MIFSHQWVISDLPVSIKDRNANAIVTSCFLAIVDHLAARLAFVTIKTLAAVTAEGACVLIASGVVQTRVAPAQVYFIA